MPFKSKAQQRFMFARHPRIAKRWAKKYGVSKTLPEKLSGMSIHPVEYKRARKEIRVKY